MINLVLVVGRASIWSRFIGIPVKSFHGFDYVTVPNYISLDKKSLMLESAEERDAAIHAALIEQGFTDNAATDLVHHFSAMKISKPCSNLHIVKPRNQN